MRNNIIVVQCACLSVDSVVESCELLFGVKRSFHCSHRHPVRVILLYTRQITQVYKYINMACLHTHTIVHYNSALTIILLYSRGRATRPRRFRFSGDGADALPAVPAVIISRAVSAPSLLLPPTRNHIRQRILRTLYTYCRDYTVT